MITRIEAAHDLAAPDVRKLTLLRSMFGYKCQKAGFASSPETMRYCFVQGNPLTAEKKDLSARSIDELIQILEFAEAEEKIMVLNELHGRDETASRALPYVVKIGLNIMAAYPSDPSDRDSFMKTSKPLLPALCAAETLAAAHAG
jgi:hypothetical protein